MDDSGNEAYIIAQLDDLISESHNTIREARACIVDLYTRNTNLQTSFKILNNSFNSLQAHDVEASQEAIKLRRILHGVVAMVHDNKFREGYIVGDSDAWEEATQILGLEDSQYDIDDF